MEASIAKLLRLGHKLFTSHFISLEKATFVSNGQKNYERFTQPVQSKVIRLNHTCLFSVIHYPSALDTGFRKYLYTWA